MILELENYNETEKKNFRPSKMASQIRKSFFPILATLPSNTYANFVGKILIRLKNKILFNYFNRNQKEEKN